MPVDTRERRRLTAALLGGGTAPVPDEPDPGVVRGTLVDIGPHLISVATPQGEERFVLAEDSVLWRGRVADVTELSPGQDVIVRTHPDNRWVAQRVWSGLARVTGVIVAEEDGLLEVDTGHDRRNSVVAIPYRSSGRIQVRHPILKPGYLFDAVGLDKDGEFQAMIPVTSQPPYPVAETPRRPAVRRRPTTVSGTVGWYDPAEGRSGDPLATATGAAYPALDRSADCGPGCDQVTSCAPLPLLSIGTSFRLRNDCTGRSAALQVIACGSATARFCDRCATCGSEERGRIAQLTLTSFIALGGLPEAGCFNATLTVG
ncbi:hypothetical protein ACQEU5_07595 [Marinactinospora thermotolerans]|uniref:hypothetical protein n=1 Tax=Marinactinospora thermotolerans TaxID=531310 RepID=UPI003D8B117D